MIIMLISLPVVVALEEQGYINKKKEKTAVDVNNATLQILKSALQMSYVERNLFNTLFLHLFLDRGQYREITSGDNTKAV